MFRDIDTLEKAIMNYQQDKDNLPLYGLSEKTFNISNTLLDTLDEKGDDVSKLKIINKSLLKDYLSKDTKYGKYKNEDDEYLYSELTGNVYYSTGLKNSKEINYHSYDSQKPSIVQNPFIKVMGGSLNDEFRDVKQTNDGGYIAVGYTKSTIGNFKSSKGDEDCLIVKFDSNGNVEWNNVLGSLGKDKFNNVKEINNGEYIAVGRTETKDKDFNESKGESDALIVKFDNKGSINWHNTFGDSKYEEFSSINKTKDNGFILVGSTISSDGNFLPTHGNDDALIVKLNSKGKMEWNSVLGGTSLDYFVNVEEIIDKGYVVGHTKSINGSFGVSKGGYDALIVKFDNKGKLTKQ